jgi:hypothetical protein
MLLLGYEPVIQALGIYARDSRLPAFPNLPLALLATPFSPPRAVNT